MNTSAIEGSIRSIHNPTSVIQTNLMMLKRSECLWPLASIALLGFLSVFIGPPPAFAQSGGRLPNRPLESELRFSVGKQGRQLIIPVVVEGTELPLVLDTGCTASSIDVRFFQGKSSEPAGRHEIRSSNGTSMLFSYACKSIALRDHVLGEDVQVLGTDLAWIQRYTGDNVCGILGMDFLRHHLLFIDFDEGIVAFLPPDQVKRLGDVAPIPLQFEANCPYVAVTLPGGKIESFLIDLGANATTLRKASFDEMTMAGHLALGRACEVLSIHGRSDAAEGILDEMQLGQHSILGKVVLSGSSSTIGRDFLSRYQILLDFPRGQLFIQPGKAFDKPESVATWGARFMWIDQRFVLDFVRENGPASQAGLQVADELRSIDGKEVQAMDLFEISQVVSSAPGRRLSIEYLRQESVHSTEVVLEKR